MDDGPDWLAATAPVGVNAFESPDPDSICCNRMCVTNPVPNVDVSSVDGLFGAGGATTTKVVVVLVDAVAGGCDEVVPVPDPELLHEASIMPPTTMIPNAPSLIRRIVPHSVSPLFEIALISRAT
jgi:hypothetical protein